MRRTWYRNSLSTHMSLKKVPCSHGKSQMAPLVPDQPRVLDVIVGVVPGHPVGEGLDDPEERHQPDPDGQEAPA
jgi:hypothetical protein